MAGGYRMFRCGGCGTSFVHPVLSDEALSAFYADYHRGAAEGGWYDDVEDRMQSDFPAKVRLAKGDRGAGRLLDVGCGKGYFVKACVEQGIDAEGVDLSETGIRHAREVLKVKAHEGLLRNLKAQLGQFDTITCWATVEHLPDPVGMMRDMRDLLKPGGRLLLDTGVGDDWLDRLLPGCVQWFDPPQHLFVFSVEGMRRALTKAGFEGIEIDPSFDRSAGRRMARTLRNGAAATMLRVASAVTRLGSGPFEFRRYPVGNLMSVSARRPAGH